jgi:putative ABC transport system permease protein
MLNRLPPRVRGSFRLAVRRPAWSDADVDDELRFHVEMRVEQLMARGATRAEAEEEARRRFGPSWDEAVRHLHRSGRAREERLAMRERFDAVWQDLRYAVRTLRRAPRFALAAVLSLALGLGATTVVFSLVDHVVLRPLPYADPARLVVVREAVADLSTVYPTMPANASHYLEFRRACTVCDGVAAIKRSALTLTGVGDPQRVGAVRVSANLFSVLGVAPALGRGFRAEEDRPGAARVVVLSDAFWRRQFGGDPRVIGRTVTLNDAAFEIVGVLPPRAGLQGGDALGALVGLPREVDVYRPLALTRREETTPGEFDYAVIARLGADATSEQLEGQLAGLTAGMLERSGQPLDAVRPVVTPLQEQVVGGAGRPLLVLLAAVAAVLLIVCVNLANLALVRAAGRERESAVRVAMGAGRARIARLALAESLVLAVVGCAAALLLARWGLDALVALAPATLPRIGEVRLDGRVFASVAVLAAVVALVVGALPALRAGRVQPAETLKAGTRTVKGGRIAARRRALFIAAQVAFSTVLLVAAGLLLTSFQRVLRVERGFETEGVLALDVVLPGNAYASDVRRMQYFDRVQAELAGVRGVSTAAVASAMPLEGETWVDGIARAEDGRSGGERPTANLRFVTPTYFAAVGTPVRRGRAFVAEDRGRRTVVVSERVARTLWPGEDAVGQRIMAGNNDTAAVVVGVASDVRTSRLEEEGSLVVYLPAWEYPPAQATLVVRTSADADAVTGAVRAALRRVDPAVPVARVRTMSDVVATATAARRFQLGLLALFAAMALVTAATGIYGVIAQSLASRAGEIGVRLALGARPADVRRLVLREGLTPAAVGLVVGVAAAVVLGRGLQAMLFQVRPGDPATLAGVTLVLGAVALVACAIPARRAAATGVAAMLRQE